MTTMLDKAAEALCARTEGRDDVWADLSDGERDGYKDLVYAVLQAIREPDLDMTTAWYGDTKGDPDHTGRSDEPLFDDGWPRVIDDILEGKA